MSGRGAPPPGFARTHLKFGAWWDFAPDWLAPTQADVLLDDLLARDDWQQIPIQVFGREVLQPRLMTWGGDTPYRYSGLTLEPRPLDATLQGLLDRVSDVVGEPFDHVMLNLYRSGEDRIGPHADDEPELGRDPVIASLSLGATRRFVAQPKRRFKSRRKERLGLTHGSLLVMGGAFQRAWYHGVPAQPTLTEPRINVTFRRLMGPPGWRPGPDDR